ncbi:glycosyltransferase [Oceanobacillus sp. CFH 90083]|uniref:glycosyltransferase n=1 Tax=Oceanobacillus sp. CFH 90083 TaxID=2592336 RepID=UPI00128E4ABD|nr:glycosyltransferase [Oceanobacillus sp. CFH 90083]
MTKLKILFMTRDDHAYTVPASYYFIQELRKITDLFVSHQAGDIKQILDSISFKPDFIFFNDYLENGSPIITGLKNLTIPFAVGLHDLHFQTALRKAIIEKENIQHIFTFYRDKFLQWYPEFNDRMHWLPHHAHQEIYQDYQHQKDIPILLTGPVLEDFYPLRAIMQMRLKNRADFVHHLHPGYRTIHADEKDAFVGKSYAQELNRSKIVLSCDSIFKYPLMKYFEITACNTLLLASYSKELGDLGFVPGVHFVAIDELSFEEKIDYYLHHQEERECIARNGMMLTKERHTTEKRAKEFLAEIEAILMQGTY